ncbi:N-terminal C2 in EEIG1 and EHBP1 proteins-domain-containing protein [Radiomyces spectabilis]|uniref:N-terminal C2 in EEIG1 and EHBP1 proteins-domain-containing protein n=1 Tax=Radiomyces spectabilis TaxID=64574 RepID=UPI00222072D5|nr:N-terminal C2 in EEIG1 and EHBP1 proteins-domain-containing protein [Radiomyces spectabilis]KAI8384445.1 N-terminal C2 in EEIG1 and EHBP1 proteins-domain-containing protein [Radiomyces spectabilis]
MSFSRLFISSHRKVDFDVSFLIQDLANVPLVSGLYFVKWRIKHASPSNGYTARESIKDHCIVWNQPANTMVQLIINKHQALNPCELKLEVFQQLGGSKAIVAIGDLTINLSEYSRSGLTTRRYLLDHCKFNSTIKLSINLTQKSRIDAEFSTPPLKKQHMFTDIPSLITERKDRNRAIEEQSLGEASFENDLRAGVSMVRKSSSVMSLPQFCRQTSTSERVSPKDLVEQLFIDNHL